MIARLTPDAVVDAQRRNLGYNTGSAQTNRLSQGGSGHYIFLGPDGGHYRRSNYARRVFRPACDGRHESTAGRPARLVIADTTVWPGIPVAAWPPTLPDASPAAGSSAVQHTDFTPPRGRGVRAIPVSTPLACWLALKPGLTPHGLRHSHKTWMAEDGIPEILAEQRLGHEVPGMRGLYAHVSDRMRDELRAALQIRWDDSLRARAAIDSHSPVPLLDKLLAPFRAQARESAGQTRPPQTRPSPQDRALRCTGCFMYSAFLPWNCLTSSTART